MSIVARAENCSNKDDSESDDRKMRKQKRTQITFETERLLLVSRRRNLIAPCAACGAQTRMITVDEAAALAQVSALAIYHRVEAGTLHFMESPAGALLICFSSLNDSILKQ